ncbi:MAG TPA: hypothetical protein PLF22_13120, partial [Pseudomonadales bacterium]|nr:hypothetical protein [Pseudomonadales bacterium]
MNPAVVLLHDALQGDANQAMFLMGQCRQFAQAVSHLDAAALDHLPKLEVEVIARRFRALRRKIVAYIRRYDEPVSAANQLLALLKENPVLP